MISNSPYKSLRAKHKVFDLRHPEVRELLYSLRYGLPRGSDGSQYSYPLSVLAKLSGYSPSYLSCWLKNEKARREQGNLSVDKKVGNTQGKGRYCKFVPTKRQLEYLTSPDK